MTDGPDERPPDGDAAKPSRVRRAASTASVAGAAVGTHLSRVPRPNPVERRMSRFLREPPTVRTAASVIVTATAAVVVLSGILMRILDHEEYSNIWVGMWWAIQTVTTVGYGDVTPKHTSGRIVATFVMLEGIALLTVTIAAVTSTFVARAEREREAAEDEVAETEARLEGRLDALDARLDGIEALLREQAKPRGD